MAEYQAPEKQTTSRYCIDREISEDEAVICLAEGWSTAEPPTAKMLANSYYAKAFEKVRAGKLTWNWAAAFGGVFWLMYHKMYMIGLLFTLCGGFIVGGVFGNNLLLYSVKTRFSKGYHKLPHYRGASMLFATLITVTFILALNVCYLTYCWETIPHRKLTSAITMVGFAALAICVVAWGSIRVANKK